MPKTITPLRVNRNLEINFSSKSIRTETFCKDDRVVRKQLAMSVILGSEIARLVFGYLQEEQLDEAATAFCKTSPYLVDEYDWLQRGYRAYKISDCDICLVDIIREHCEIKYAVAEYIESLSSSLGETLKLPKSLSGKINSIFDLLTNTPKPTSRKRPYSVIATNIIEATPSNELPGYEPPLKERRLSRKLILRQEITTPKQSSAWTPTLKQQEQHVIDDQDEENVSPEQANNAVDRSRNETSQYPIFTETILENTQFQNVLVENINRILETSTDRIDLSTESRTHETVSNNNSLQEQVKHAIDNIIMSTEQDPTFQQVLDDVVQHTAIHEQTNRVMMSIANDAPNNSCSNNDITESPVPLKNRLRNRSQDKPRPNYNEIDPNTKKKRKGKVEVISNEIVSGEIRDLLNSTTTTTRTDSYVPLNQILYLNPDKSTSSFGGQDLVYVNVGSCVPSFSQFRIDADTPMYLQDISLANSGTSTSLTPGSIINLPAIQQPLQPIQSMLPNVIIKDIVEVSKTKQIERSVKGTPSAAKNVNKIKSRNLTSPRRQSHVRSLNFTTSDDSANQSERLTNPHSENNKKVEQGTSDGGGSAVTKSHATLHTESDDSNQKTSLEEVEPQQDSSDAVDFSKEFDEATVISVELSPSIGDEQPNCSKEEKPAETASGKKKPQTRQQCQKDLEMWNQMRQMKKGEWDNYLRQTVASGKTGRTAVDKKKVKKRKSKNCRKPDEANISGENSANTTTDVEARLLEEALESAKKTTPSPVTVKNSNPIPEVSTLTNDSERPLKVSSPPQPVAAAEKLEGRSSQSIKRSSDSNRKRLIHVKLPASTKKKLNMSMKRRAKPTPKRTINGSVTKETRAVETSRIDPSQTIDIDLISPIEHPKELNNTVKKGINLNSFLETPDKESSSFKYPITPGFTVSSSIKTPVVRLMKDFDSIIKFPEYPTPSFAITPGRTKTPMSQSSSQKDGSSYNRATDYSSGSSYYKPDESDDIDKNLDVLIKENRMVECSLGVDPQHNTNFGNDPAVSDGECSESSTSSSSSTSSQTSTNSSCSSSPSFSTSGNDKNNLAQTSEDINNAKKLFIAQRTQHQLRLEQVRLRTMATLKTDKKIERFRKPKTKISTLQRNKVMEGSGMIKKPVQTLKMTGNSTPKVASKVLTKHVSKPNPKTLTITPSKRKNKTPRRVIYLDYKDTIKTNVRVDRKQTEPLLLQANDNATIDILKQSVTNVNPPRAATPVTETIDAIENHIAKTCQSSFVEFKAISATENQVDTPNLLHQLQDKNETSNNASTPEMGPPATSNKRATLVRELFGDGTMSDSDFMDTPVKTTNNSQGQPIVPSLQATELTDSSKNGSTVERRVASPLKICDKQKIPIDSKEAKSVESKVIDSKPNDDNSTTNVIVKDVEIRTIEDKFEDTTTTKELIADDLKSVECSKDEVQSKTIDSQIANPDDNDDSDGDDYDDCTLISSLPLVNMSNRIYENVISDTKQCAMQLTREDLDLRPVSTYLDGRKIIIKTCDEIILYNAQPKTDLPSTPSTSSGGAVTKNLIKKRTNAKTVDGSGVRKVEERCKKAQKSSYDGADNAAPEKNARFYIVAKQKGPIDVSSTPTSSSREQRKISHPTESQPHAGTSNEMKKSTQQQKHHTKITPLLNDMDINKVLGKIHPSKEIA